MVLVCRVIIVLRPRRGLGSRFLCRGCDDGAEGEVCSCCRCIGGDGRRVGGGWSAGGSCTC